MEKDANFIACLALYQSKRDKAIGLHHVTSAQQGLLWYYKVLQQREYMKAFHYGVIKGARARIKQIKKQVTKDTPIRKAQLLLNEALNLQKQIETSQKVIDG